MINWIKIYPKNTVGFWKKNLLRPSHQKAKSYSLKLEKCHVLMDISWHRRSLVQSSSLQQASFEYHQKATAYFSGPWKRYFRVWQVLFGCMSEDISKFVSRDDIELMQSIFTAWENSYDGNVQQSSFYLSHICVWPRQTLLSDFLTRITTGWTRTLMKSSSFHILGKIYEVTLK